MRKIVTVQGKENSHGDTLSKPVTCCCNCTPVCFDYSSGDGQSQTCTAYPTTTRLVSTIEAVEDVGKVCGGDSYPVIDD